ncbi:hypothetical protein H1D32_10930 [Anaerobacillus sp. CMMVII]|uniref:hypothetical protein n=1 Tax=Anaerobacillus sp. CMMVII TaxID=2755588 RepID=UPI0021B72733|nr:hypothetical protein [Anaerobacillus sp. CMMVII]MCT8138224.1 hypothetical protein [Anaerobacillus sp. CMMVII]
MKISNIFFLFLCILATPINLVQADELLDGIKRITPDNPLGEEYTIEEAVSKFEGKFHKKVLLPRYLPFEVTHSGGSYSEAQKHITVTYYNEHSQAKVQIDTFYQPISKGISGETVKLKDGSKAIYRTDIGSGFDFLFIEKDDFNYYLGIKSL